MLAVVLGGLELAKRNLSDAVRAGRYIDSATEGAHRAAALTRQLLAFSREEALKPEPLDPGKVIAGMSDLLDRTLGDAISVSVLDGAEDWRIHADRHQLENALLNLAVNARDAMAGRGALTIAAGTIALAQNAIGGCNAGEHVTIAVTDTGCGMTPDVIERAFEPFFTTKPVGKGTGLGLSQIFAFVRQSDGEIAIRSIPDEGTTVTLYLPRFGAQREREDVPAPTPADEQQPQYAGLRILVVEDDPRVLVATLGALEELGHHATGCDDPLAAPALLDADLLLDLVVSDVLMPGRTGPEMIAALDPRHAHLAVLFVTGFAGDAAAIDFGGRHVLRKPFTLAGLERAIAEAMAHGRPQRPEQIAAE
jgi:CheY-like chemotaxis protein